MVGGFGLPAIMGQGPPFSSRCPHIGRLNYDGHPQPKQRVVRAEEPVALIIDDDTSLHIPIVITTGHGASHAGASLKGGGGRFLSREAPKNGPGA